MAAYLLAEPVIAGVIFAGLMLDGRKRRLLEVVITSIARAMAEEDDATHQRLAVLRGRLVQSVGERAEAAARCDYLATVS